MIKYGFYAYGSEPKHCGEFIETAKKAINTAGHAVVLKSWKELDVGGDILISTILKEIERADFVCADVTGLNENVLFELGFAIGKRKPVWITQDVSISHSYNKYKDLNFLTSIGYVNYSKSDEIVDAFLNNKVYNKTNLVLETIPIDNTQHAEKKALLYLKSQIDTNYSQYIVREIENLKLPKIVDDASEVKVQAISWYLNQLLNIPAVLVEFSSTYRTGYELHNAKCAFIAGLALGLNLKMQMIAEKPYPTAVDYQEYLKKFTTLELCKAAVSPFLMEIKSNIAELITQKSEIKLSRRQESILQKIKFGEYVAEHESSNLYSYYVNTAHDENLIKSEYNIVVGRKGSGKTATFYYLYDALGKDVRNTIIAIKPVNFEIDGLIELIKKLGSDFEKGYIIQSVWKFLIYSEVAKQIYTEINEKPAYAIEDIDRNLKDFVDSNSEIILADFSTRLEQELINLSLLENVDEQSEFRARISEILHEKIIKQLRDLIIAYMRKKKKLVILIDNLDKNWRKGANTEIISKFILGLLGVIGRIAKEMKGNPKQPNDFILNLIVFLRSDIFKQVLSFAREPDKIEYTRLKWNDGEVLRRVVDKRLEYLSDNGTKISDQFWDKFLTLTVDGINSWRFILACIIPRPRDLLYFLASAKSIAVSRGHTMITENDIKSAYEDYSNWVFQSILVENGITIQQMQTFLYNVMSESSILTRDQIKELMIKSKMEVDELKIDYFISHLCSLSFLGREIRDLDFFYEYDFEADEKIIFLSEKLNSKRYKIHNAFMPYLECSDYNP